MNELTCWYCEKKSEYEGEKYQDIICPHCKITNSIYKPNHPDNKPVDTTTENQWLNEEEEMRIKLSDYIKADVDVKQGDIITINDEGIEQENEQFTNDDGTPKIDHIFKILLSTGEERKISMNKTSLKKIVEKYGLETSAWVGKKVVINIVMNTNGKKGIVLDPQ